MADIDKLQTYLTCAQSPFIDRMPHNRPGPFVNQHPDDRERPNAVLIAPRPA
jgi:hypothetical protein